MSEAEEAGTVETVPRDARMWAMVCHIIALVGLLGNGIGFVVGPLVVWLIKKEDHPFIDDQGKEAVNFQITMMIAFFVAALLVFVFIGFILLPILAIVDVVFTVIAAIKANDGQVYRYPFALRLIK